MLLAQFCQRLAYSFGDKVRQRPKEVWRERLHFWFRRVRSTSAQVYDERNFPKSYYSKSVCEDDLVGAMLPWSDWS
jgi:hypothetical protein